MIPSRTKQAGGDEWYTPRWLIDAAADVLGGIDMDPAAESKTAPNVPATVHFTREEDGLAQFWEGRVFLNPPWSQTSRWMGKLVSEVDAGRVTGAVAVVRALGTETVWFQRLLTDSRATICFLRGRVSYVPGAGQPGGSPTQGSLAIYVGDDGERFRQTFSHLGVVMRAGGA